MEIIGENAFILFVPAKGLKSAGIYSWRILATI
jgi:hypothetical protein